MEKKFFLLLSILMLFSISACKSEKVSIETDFTIAAKQVDTNLIIEGNTNLPDNTLLTAIVFDSDVLNSNNIYRMDEIYVKDRKYTYSYDFSNYNFKIPELNEFVLAVKYEPNQNDMYTSKSISAGFHIDFSKETLDNIYIDLKPNSSWNQIGIKGKTNLPNGAVLQFILMPNKIINNTIIETKLITRNGTFEFKDKNIKNIRTPQKLGYTVHFKFSDPNYIQPQNVLNIFGDKGQNLNLNSQNISQLEDGSYIYTKTGTFYWPSKKFYDDHNDQQEREKNIAILNGLITESIDFNKYPIESFEVVGTEYTNFRIIVNNSWSKYEINDKYAFCESMSKIFNSARKKANLKYDTKTRIKVVSINGKELIPFFTNTYKVIEE